MFIFTLTCSYSFDFLSFWESSKVFMVPYYSYFILWVLVLLQASQNVFFSVYPQHITSFQIIPDSVLRFNFEAAKRVVRRLLAEIHTVLERILEAVQKHLQKYFLLLRRSELITFTKHLDLVKLRDPCFGRFNIRL